MAKEMDKVVVMMLGDSKVGKTSIVFQYCEQVFPKHIKSTVGEFQSLYFVGLPALLEGSRRHSKESL